MTAEPMDLDLERQALVVIAMQNDFVRVGAPQEVGDARAITPIVQALIGSFRDAARPIVFTRFVAGPQETLITRWSPECGPGIRSCWPGEWRSYGDAAQPLEGFDVIPELVVRPHDLIVDKYGYGAFVGTYLADALRARHCDQVVTCGVVTQICVEDTVRQGLQHGFEMVVVPDAVAAFDAELHRASLRSMGMKFARLQNSPFWTTPEDRPAEVPLSPAQGT